MDSLIFSSVENIPGVSARAAFTVNSAAVFREDCDIMPVTKAVDEVKKAVAPICQQLTLDFGPDF